MMPVAAPNNIFGAKLQQICRAELSTQMLARMRHSRAAVLLRALTRARAIMTLLAVTPLPMSFLLVVIANVAIHIRCKDLVCNQLMSSLTVITCAPVPSKAFCVISRTTELPKCIANAAGDRPSCADCHANCTPQPNARRTANEKVALDFFFNSTKGIDGWVHTCSDGWHPPRV
jgi:hypothetical protein